MDDKFQNTDAEQIKLAIRNIEDRLSRIESHLRLELILQQKEQVQEPKQNGDRTDEIEFELGQHWFARFGIVALALGIAFLLTFPYENIPPVTPIIFGYVLVVCLAVVSHITRNSLDLISRYLMGGGLVLFYFTTLRLYFFSAQPMLTLNSFINVIPLICVVAIVMVVAIQRRSVYLVSFSLMMGYITALVIDDIWVIFISSTILAMLTVYFSLKYSWRNLMITGIILTYLTHLLWIINNPIAGGQIVLIKTPSLNLYFLIIYLIIFALGNLLRPETQEENYQILLNTLLNCAGGYGLYLVSTFNTFIDAFAGYQLLSAVIFLSISTAFWIKEKSKYQTFIWSMLGYLALSASIMKASTIPDAFIWLSIQSFLVLSTAIWFRSRFIVVANFILYVIILIIYLVAVEKINAIGLSFGAIALLSARILNWQQNRLELKTEAMRNAYLVAAFLTLPYMLYHLVPHQYISLAWLGVALLYYLLNLVIQKQKYRWMAHLTLILTVLYTLVVGIISLEPTLRIVSFIILGIVLLVVSVVITKQRIKK